MYSEYDSFLEQVRYPLRLGCLDLSGWPVVVSLWYIWENGQLYCATQANARVVGYLEKNPSCGFEISNQSPPYCGVRGRAVAQILPERGPEILEKLLDRYLMGKDDRLVARLKKNIDQEVAVCLVPQQMTSWNFSKRMAKITLPFDQNDICPPNTAD